MTEPADADETTEPRGDSTSGDPWLNRDLGAYRIESRLGGGGMGVVYKAFDRRLRRAVAIKVMSEALAENADALRRFVHEARAAARLNHPNVVTIHEVEQHERRPFLVMEWIAGGSAQDQIRAHGRATWEDATRMIADACRGLAAAHDAGLVHRDIKPANLLRAADGVVKIADFGIAKASDTTGPAITRTGHVLGTPDFMSPEQCRSQPMEHRSDIYSLGSTYYYLLTGKTPFPAPDPIQVMFAHCSKPPPDPRLVHGDIPVACSRILVRAMAKKRSDRYPDARAMLADLEAIVATSAAFTPVAPGPPTGRSTSPPTVDGRGQTEGFSEKAPTPSRFSVKRRPQWTRRLVMAACVVLLSAVAVGMGLFLTGVGRPSPRGPLTLRLRQTLIGHTQAIRTTRFSDDGRMLATAGFDREAIVWSMPAGEKRWSLPADKGPTYAAAFSTDGRTLATTTDGGVVHLWNLDAGTLRTTLKTPAPVWDVAFADDDKTLVAAIGYAGLIAWRLDDRRTYRESHRVPFDGHLANGLATSPSRDQFATVVFDRSARLFAFADVAQIDAVEAPTKPRNIAFAPGGQTLAIAAVGTVVEWTPGQKLVPIANTAGAAVAVAYSPDGGTLAYGDDNDDFIHLFHRPTNTDRAIRADGPVRAIAFSPDGALLVSGAARNGVVQVWDVVPETP